MFTQLIHPLSIGLILVIHTCLICLTAGLISQSFWFSYVLFLIFLGGLLVLFIYVASLASNEPFKFSILRTSFLVALSLFFVILIFTDITIMTSKLSFISSSLLIDNFNHLKLVGSIYRGPTINLTLYLVIYLLLTLFAIVKITGNEFGPLRLSTYDYPLT